MAVVDDRAERRHEIGPDHLRVLDGALPLAYCVPGREPRVVLSDGVLRVLDRCAAEGVNPGYPLGRTYPEYATGLLVAITEQRSRADIDRLVDVLGRAVAAERHPVGATA